MIGCGAVTVLAVLFVNATGRDDGANDSANCGARALCACLDELGLSVREDEMMLALPRNGEDSSLSELAAEAAARGLEYRAARWTTDVPTGAPPAIVPVALRDGRRHFVAVRKWRGWQVLVQDGERTRWLSAQALRRAEWDGTALHLARDAGTLDSYLPPFWKSDRFLYAGATILFIGAALILRRGRTLRRAHAPADVTPLSRTPA